MEYELELKDEYKRSNKYNEHLERIKSMYERSMSSGDMLIHTLDLIDAEIINPIVMDYEFNKSDSGIFGHYYNNFSKFDVSYCDGYADLSFFDELGNKVCISIPSFMFTEQQKGN